MVLVAVNQAHDNVDEEIPVFQLYTWAGIWIISSISALLVEETGSPIPLLLLPVVATSLLVKRYPVSLQITVFVLLSFSISTPFPSWYRVSLEFLLYAASFFLMLAALAGKRAVAPIAAIAWVVIVYWVLLASHPNVPSLSVGALGVRKSTLALAGLALGVAWPRSRMAGLTHAAVGVVVSLGIVNALIHLLAPDFERTVSRSAGIYTGLFNNQSRMQGILSGPFQVALLGVFLVLVGVISFPEVRRPSRRLLAPFATIIVGAYMVQQSQVRSALIVLVVVLVALPLVRTTRSRRDRHIRRLRFLVLIVGAAVLWTVGDSATASLGGLASDTRALGRIETWSEGWTLFVKSPIFGWGAGSAGDTLEDAFASGAHVTAHSVPLKYLVEGGSLGVLCLLILTVVIIGTIVRGFAPLAAKRMSFAAIGAIAGMGLTVNIVEANPVAFLLLMIVGITVDRSPGGLA